MGGRWPRKGKRGEKSRYKSLSLAWTTTTTTGGWPPTLLFPVREQGGKGKRFLARRPTHVVEDHARTFLWVQA